MNKNRNLILTAFAAIVLNSCNSEDDTKAVTVKWDGVDYNTGVDTTINNQTYHFSSYGYWYFYNNDRVTRYYPKTGYTETLSAEDHKSGRFLTSSNHSQNGGVAEEPANFSSGRGGATASSSEEGLGSTARSGSSEGVGESGHSSGSGESAHSGGFGESAHGGGFGGGE